MTAEQIDRAYVAVLARNASPLEVELVQVCCETAEELAIFIYNHHMNPDDDAETVGEIETVITRAIEGEGRND